MLIALMTAIATTILGALAAYAFSRFRFRGRRGGMLGLLLIQMFPQFVAVAAIYLIILNVGEVFPQIGLDKQAAVVIVYLGGALGVQAWLMKGYFDTIPTELDESAKVDGATAAQIFWGVVLPLAAPVLAVVALISFVFTLNEFVIASAILQTTSHKTLPVGMQLFISGSYDKVWGPFAAGALLAAIPVAILFLFLQPLHRQRADCGLRQGMSVQEQAGGRAPRPAAPRRLGPVRARAAAGARRRGGRAPARAARRDAPTASSCATSATASLATRRRSSTRRPRRTSGGAPRSRSRTRSRATAGCSRAATPATPG